MCVSTREKLKGPVPKVVPPKYTVVYPAQCPCGHLYLERYEFRELTDEGNIGFVWCGFCRTRVNVKPYVAAGCQS